MAPPLENLSICLSFLYIAKNFPSSDFLQSLSHNDKKIPIRSILFVFNMLQNPITSLYSFLVSLINPILLLLIETLNRHFHSPITLVCCRKFSTLFHSLVFVVCFIWDCVNFWFGVFIYDLVWYFSFFFFNI